MRLSPALTFITAAAVLSVVAQAAYVPHIKWVNCSDHVPDVPGALDLSDVNLAALPSTLWCGRIEVPMDYSKPISESNSITLGLAMHRPAKPKGAIFHNPGGTDATAVIAWQVALGQTEEWDGLLDYDLMMMDVRGIYSSNPISVNLTTFLPLAAPLPTTQAGFDAFRNASAGFFQSWIDSSSPPGIIAHISVKEFVRDLDNVREALGYEKINYIGGSYGTYRGQQYANTFPERVEHFALDAVFPHGWSSFEQAQAQIEAINRGMLRADAYCVNNATCPFKGGKGSVPKAFEEILALTAKTGLNASLIPWSVQNTMYGALQGATDKPDFPAIIDGLHATLTGDASFFTASGNPTVESVVGIPIECGDYTIANDFEEYNRSLTNALAHDTSGVRVALTLQSPLWCSGWPFTIPPNVPLPVEKKMLLITADFDTEAPTEGATFAWKQTPNSGLIVRHGDDHVSFPLVYEESTALTKEFLRTGVLPCARNETFLTVYEPGMMRAPIANPYDVPTGPAAGDIDSGINVNGIGQG